jgi:steroid delta-isomerase-like uncharacterized protein
MDNKRDTEALIRKYYELFNSQDWEAFVGLLAEDVLHEVSQGDAQVGRAAFRAFMHHMDQCYRERVSHMWLVVSDDGRRAAAEFQLDGTYLSTDPGFPPATGQTYKLRVGAFFEVRGGLITRVSNHYNLKSWLAQVQ